MIKKITYFLILSLLAINVVAQSENDNNDDLISDEEYVITKDSLKTKDKLHYGFEMGAGFGHSSMYGNYFSTYYKPMISYDVSSRFSVNTGIQYVNSSVNNFPVIAENNYQLFSGSIAQYYAFIGGQYKLTDKLSVGGSVFYDFISYNKLDGTSFSGGKGLDNLGYSAYFKYKAAKHLTIEGEIRVNDKNPYNRYSSPFSNGFMGAGTSFFGR